MFERRKQAGVLRVGQRDEPGLVTCGDHQFLLGARAKLGEVCSESLGTVGTDSVDGPKAGRRE
jgi:hypothetical protein